MCDRQKHFSFNYENKGLAAKLRILGFRVFECPCDADIAIVKKALKSSKEQPVIVYADDTDIIYLLLHLYHSTTDLKDIFLAEMTRPSATQMLFNQRSYQFLKQGGQRCPIYCLLMLSLILIWILPIQPSTY